MNAATETRPEQYLSSQSDMGNNKLTVEVSGSARKTFKSERNPGPNPNANHAWEKCGLGVAPYQLIGCGEMTYQACRDAPIQPGASCDYCGQGIMQVYFIKGACGSVFHVGCDCVERACDKKEGVRSAVEMKAKAHARKVRAARTKVKNASVSETLAGLTDDAHMEIYRSMPHPKHNDGAFFAAKSYADYVGWMVQNCGAAGRARLVKTLEAALAAR